MRGMVTVLPLRSPGSSRPKGVFSEALKVGSALKAPTERLKRSRAGEGSASAGAATKKPPPARAAARARKRVEDMRQDPEVRQSRRASRSGSVGRDGSLGRERESMRRTHDANAPMPT